MGCRDAIVACPIHHSQIANHKDSPSSWPEFFLILGIFAVAGSGKTNLSNLLILRFLKLKIPFIVIDWKRSW
ncbi:MAG: DUF87 domain-containing protein [Deltaproteobacteria bacterium]|nr:DUF87 domain-containing protein [Deltaproteobacteria bacterium]